MAELSSQFTSISPGMTTDNATDYLVSTMQAYGIAVDDVERKIMDNVNKIGNTFATTNAEIGEMLTRSSAAMKAANNSLEETIALESAAVEITRNAETTGTAFRTVSMRIRGLDEETEEALEDYEVIKGKIADLTKTASTPQGISLFTDKTKTTYKSTYQFLKEISEIWDQLTDKNQASLLETIAGKRGGQVLAGILSDFSEVERALETMEGAAGSADKEMSIIQDSIEYKLNALKQTWVGVLQDTVNRDSFKNFIDFLTQISEGLGDIIDKVGMLGTALIGVGAIIGGMKGWQSGFKFIPKMGNSIKNFFQGSPDIKNQSNLDYLDKVQEVYDEQGGNISAEQMDSLADNIGNVTESAKAYGRAWTENNNIIKEGQKLSEAYCIKFSSGLKKLGRSILDVGKSLLSSLAGAVVGGVIGYIAAEATNLIISAGKWIWDNWLTDNAKNQRAEESINHLKEASAAYKETSKNVGDLTNKYKELHEKLKDSNLSIDEELSLKEELLGIQDSLVESYGTEAENIDLVNGKYQEQLELLENINRSKARDYLYGKEGVLKQDEYGLTDIDRANDYINATVGSDDRFLEDVFKDLYIGNKRKNLNTTGIRMDDILKKYSALSEWNGNGWDPYGPSGGEYGSGILIAEGTTKKEAYEQLTDLLQDVREQLGSDETQWTQAQTNLVMSIENAINKLDFDPTEYQNMITMLENTVRAQMAYDTNDSVNSLEEDAKDAVTEYNKALKAYESDANQETKEALDEAANNLEEVEERIREYNPGDSLREGYDNIFNSILGGKSQSINEWFRDYAEKNKEVSKILKDEYAKLSMDEKVQLKLKLDETDMRAVTKETIYKIIEEAQAEANAHPIDLSFNADKMVDSMADMKTAVASLGDLWEQTVKNQLAMKKDKKYLSEDGTVLKQSDTNDLAVGAADPALLNSVESAFNNYISLLSDDEAAKAMNTALKQFEETMIQFPNDADAAQKAIDTLINSYIDQTKVLDNLNESNQEWAKEQLEAMGITNADAVVTTRLNKANKQLLSGMSRLNDAFRLYGSALETGETAGQGYLDGIDLIKSTLKDMFTLIDAEGNKIGDFDFNFDESFIIEHLDMIRQAAYGDVDAINELRREASKQIIAQIEIQNVDPSAINGIRDEINALIDGVDLDSLEIGTTFNDKNVIEGLNHMIKMGLITQESMNNILAGIGVVPKIDMVPVDIKTYNGNALQELKQQYGAQAGEQAYKTMTTAGQIYVPSISYQVGSKIAGAHYSKPSGSSSSSSSNGSNSNGSKSKLQEDTKETFDWIEKKIQRLDEAIARLDKTMNNTYEDWSDRNKALVKELDKVTEEMGVHEHAYKRYLENANKLKVEDVNVAPNEEDSGSKKQYDYDQQQWDKAIEEWNSGKYQKLVREGKIGKNDIEQIQNKYLVETINQYIELYQKAVDAGDAIQDDKIKLGDLNKTRFDHIKSEFDAIIQGFTDLSDIVDERISRSQEHGYFVNQKYYQQQIQLEKEANQHRIEEYKKLVAARDKAVETGAIELGSEAYTEMTQTIMAMRKEIEASATSVQKLNNEIRQLKWDAFDYWLDRLGLITDEAEFLIDMLDQHDLIEENGKFNGRGWASAGLMATEYDVYMQKSKEYAKEMADIEKEIADEMEKNGVVDKNLIERRESLLKLQQDSIKAAEQEKEAIKDLVSQAITKHLEMLQKLIDKYKETLSNAKSAYEYSKNISQQTKNIADLQKQLEAYRGDDSEEARATIQRLAQSLKEAEEGLKETEWDKYIEETGKLLDDMYEKYEETLNERLKDIDKLMEDMIGYINSNSELINNTLKEVSEQYGYDISEETQNILDGEGEMVSAFNKDFNDKMADAILTIKDIKDAVYELAFGKNAKNVVDSEGTGRISGNWRKNSKGYWYQYDDGSYAKNETVEIGGKFYHFDDEGYMVTNQYSGGYWFGKNGTKSGEMAQWHKTSKGWWYGDSTWYAKDATYTIDGVEYTFDKDGYLVMSGLEAGASKKIKGYATGSSGIKSNQIAWTQENGSELIYRKSDGAMLTRLNTGDMVFTNDMTKQLWDIAKNPSILGANAVAASARTVNNDNDITIVLPNVKNYDEFKTALQKDPKFTNFIQATTLGQSLGKGKLNRGNY